jgi:hypothetical protein
MVHEPNSDVELSLHTDLCWNSDANGIWINIQHGGVFKALHRQVENQTLVQWISKLVELFVESQVISIAERKCIYSSLFKTEETSR